MYFYILGTLHGNSNKLALERNSRNTSHHTVNYQKVVFVKKWLYNRKSRQIFFSSLQSILGEFSNVQLRLWEGPREINLETWTPNISGFQTFVAETNFYWPVLLRCYALAFELKDRGNAKEKYGSSSLMWRLRKCAVTGTRSLTRRKWASHSKQS